MLVIFHRQTDKQGRPCKPCWYSIDLTSGLDTPKHIEDHVKLNPGTTKVMDMHGRVLWPPN